MVEEEMEGLGATTPGHALLSKGREGGFSKEGKQRTFRSRDEESDLQGDSRRHEFERARDRRVRVTLLSRNVQCSEE